VGNAVTNVLPAGDVAGAGVQYQMLAMVGINADSAAGGLAAASIIGLAGLFMLPVCVVPAILGGFPVSPGLEHAAYLGLAGFVLIVAFRRRTADDQRAPRLARSNDPTTLELDSHREVDDEDLPERLIAERNLVAKQSGTSMARSPCCSSEGRIGFDYFALLLCAARHRRQSERNNWSSWAYAATAVIALVPLTPADSASSKRVSADSSS